MLITRTSRLPLALLLLAAGLTGCQEHKNPGSMELAPGVYAVTTAQYEAADDDYELTLKEHGEYDIPFQDLYVVMDPQRPQSTLEITPEYRNILYVTHPRDLQREFDVPDKKKTAVKAKAVKPVEAK